LYILPCIGFVLGEFSKVLGTQRELFFKDFAFFFKAVEANPESRVSGLK
jgi:hypothetical protein